MKELNRAQVTGRIGKDLKLAYTAGQTPKAVLSFSLASKETWKDEQGNPKEATEWHNIAVFGPTAEFIQRTFRKGSRITVEGRLKTRKWRDNQTGADRYTTEIVVDRPEHRIDAAEWPSYQSSTDQSQQPSRQPVRGQPSSQPQQQSARSQTASQPMPYSSQQNWDQEQPFGG